jgi:hypothetical protein
LLSNVAATAAGSRWTAGRSRTATSSGLICRRICDSPLGDGEDLGYRLGLSEVTRTPQRVGDDVVVLGLEEAAELFLARGRGGRGLALFPQSSLKRPSERPERARRVKNAANDGFRSIN